MIFSEVQMPLGDLESVNLISLPSYNSFSMKKKAIFVQSTALWIFDTIVQQKEYRLLK
jgi:hypothetical protein